MTDLHDSNLWLLVVPEGSAVLSAVGVCSLCHQLHPGGVGCKWSKGCEGVTAETPWGKEGRELKNHAAWQALSAFLCSNV